MTAPTDHRLVQELAAWDPMQEPTWHPSLGYWLVVCAFCQRIAKDDADHEHIHPDDCLWAQARELVQNQEVTA